MSILVTPFIGIKSFDEAHSSFFYGRDREIQEILALILSSGVSLVYSKSGIGKTSIFNAKIIPELQGDKYRCQVLPVTRFKTLSTLTDQKEKESEISNPFIFNTLQGIIEKSASLLEDTNLLKKINKMTLSEFLKEYTILNKEESFDKYYYKIRILIFDQFEEFFNIYINNRFKQQKDFFYQIKDAIDNDPSLRVVFIMREEHVANLDTFSYIFPDGFRRKFRLEPLRRESAIQAVEKPMFQALVREPKLKEIIDEEDIKKISNKVVENLLKVHFQRYYGKTEIMNGEFVEPVQLQVVCQRLWDKKILAGKIKNEIDSIQFGDVDNALTDFYVDAVTTAKESTKTKEHSIREWCEEKLITPAGTRGIVYQDVNVTGGMSNKVVDVLQSKYLIRAEERAGSKWFELTHDRIIKPIKDSNKNYEEKEKRKLYRIIKILVPVIATISIFAIFINLPYFESLAVQDKQAETLINNNVTIKMKYNHSFPLSSYTYFIKSYPKNGMLIPIANDTVVYEPFHRYVGHDGFTYVVSNGKKNSSNTGLIDIHIKHIPLTAINQTVESMIDKPIILSVIDWDYPTYTNIRNVGILPIKLLNGPYYGYLTSEINSNKIIYTPYKGYTGTDYFEFCLPDPENTTNCSTDKSSLGYVDLSIRPIPKYFGYLMVDNGITQGTLYPIYSTTNTIGRATIHDNPDVAITDQVYSDIDRTVSRLHGKIFYLNNSFFLQDLESTNKIIAKGKKLDDRETVRLQPGDTFIMGDTKIRLITDLRNETQYKYK